MTTVIATATKAASAVTNSSGCNATLPAMSGGTAQILDLKIFNGSALVAVNDFITITGCLGGTFTIPLTQILAGATVIDSQFTNGELVGSAPDTQIQVSVPAVLGGASTTVILNGSYF